MKVASWDDLVSGRLPFQGPVRLSIGVFDGLHVGHRRLMEEITSSPPSLPLVLTFPRTPAQVLDPAHFPGLILSYRQKLARLADVGVGAVVEIDFSGEMSNLSGKAFIGLLRENLTIEEIVVGYNFRFGRAREAGSGDLKEMLVDTGIELRVTDPVLRGREIVSSSRIRKTIQDADFAETRAMLLADYSLDLRGVGCRPDGAGVVSIRRSEIEQVLPHPGRYRVDCEAGGRRSPAELAIGADSLTLDAGGIMNPAAITFH